TKRALRGAIRTCFAIALAVFTSAILSASSHLSNCFLIRSSMTFKSTSWCKFTKFVSDHIFGYIHWYMFTTIMYCECVSGVGLKYGRTSWPMSDDLLVICVG